MHYMHLQVPYSVLLPPPPLGIHVRIICEPGTPPAVGPHESLCCPHGVEQLLLDVPLALASLMAAPLALAGLMAAPLALAGLLDALLA